MVLTAEIKKRKQQQEQYKKGGKLLKKENKGLTNRGTRLLTAKMKS